jgi:hypothetical protein
MENLKHPVVLVVVFAAVLGLIYVGWNYHKANVAEEAARAFVGAPPPPDVAGFYKSKAPLPPQ